MQPAESFLPEELKGRRVAFKCDEDHATCWHMRSRLEKGVVLKRAQTLAEKMEMLGPEDEIPEHLLEEEEVPKVWVKADPTDLFPGGCEAVVDVDCLMVLEEGDRVE